MKKYSKLSSAAVVIGALRVEKCHAKQMPVQPNHPSFILEYLNLTVSAE